MAAIRIIYIMEHAFYVGKLQSGIKTDRLISGADSQAIESRFDIRGKFAFEPREIEITVKIGENRALGAQFSDPL